MDAQTKQRIEDAIASKPVFVFMKGSPEFPQCGFSARTIEILKAAGLERDQLGTMDVLEDESIRSGIKEFSNWPTIPQVYIKGDFVGGCDIMMEMYQNGELKKKLDVEASS